MRTCTTMIFTDGTTSRFAVMRGRMRGRSFDAHSARIVATYDVVGSFPVDYAGMTAAHATPDAPPVYWQVVGWQR